LILARWTIATPLKKDLHCAGGCPNKNPQVEAPTNLQKLAYQEALSLADQSEYYNNDDAQPPRIVRLGKGYFQ
jgi:hypothetical protein